MNEIKTRNDYVKAVMPDGVSIVEGTTTWCSRCKAIDPFVQKMVTKYPDARFYKYDLDEAPDIAQELGVHEVPSIAMFKDGDLVETFSGTDTAKLETKIKSIYQGEVADG